MRVIIDGIVYSSAPSGGVYNYFNELIPRLASFPNTEIEVVLSKVSEEPPHKEGVQLRRNILPSARWFPEGKLKRTLGNSKRWLEGQIKRAQMRGLGKETVFHTTGFTSSPWKSIPRIITIYDMISEVLTPDLKLPHIVKMREVKEMAIRNSDRLIAISQCTKNDLCRVYNLPESKVDVVHFGVNHDFFSNTGTPEIQEQVKAKYDLDQPYILYVGGRLHHKNFERFIRAYAQSEARKACLLGVAGFPWEEQETALIRQLGLEKRIRWMPYLTAELPVVYKMATYFVFPSLYEGFGLPLIEAMVSGCPVAAARSGPFPELAGDAVLYFDPYSVDDIAQKLDLFLEPALQAEYRARGYQQCQLYSWDVAAQRTYRTYLTALGNKNAAGILTLSEEL